MKVEKAQRRILRAIFFRRKFDSLNNIWYEHKIQTVFEMYISELIKEMFKQIRLESPVQFFTPYACKESHLPTRGSSRNNSPSKYYRTVVKRKCLENSFRKIYNYLLNLDLIPQNLLKMTKSEMKSYVDIVSLLYVRDNREVFSLFFLSIGIYIRYENDLAKILDLFSVKNKFLGFSLFIHLSGSKGRDLTSSLLFSCPDWIRCSYIHIKIIFSFMYLVYPIKLTVLFCSKR